MFKKTGENYQFKIVKNEKIIPLKCVCGNILGIKRNKKIITNLRKDAGYIICNKCGRGLKCL